MVLIALQRDLQDILLEKVVPDYNLPRLHAVCQQSVVVTRDQGQTVVTGGPLVIAFDEMFLRAASRLNEHDYVFGEEALVEIAEDTWDN